jgi:hypothetical protein
VACDGKDAFQLCSDAACKRCESVPFHDAICVSLGHEARLHELLGVPAGGEWVRAAGGDEDAEEDGGDADGASKRVYVPKHAEEEKEERRHKSKGKKEEEHHKKEKEAVFTKAPVVKKAKAQALNVAVSVAAVCQLVETKTITEVTLEKKQTTNVRLVKRLVKPAFNSVSVKCPKEEKKAEYEAPKYEAPKYEAPKYEAPKMAEEAPKYEAPAMRGSAY